MNKGHPMPLPLKKTYITCKIALMHLNDLFSVLSFANIAKLFLHKNMFLRKKIKITKVTKPSQKLFKTSRAASNNCCVFWLGNGCFACSSMVEIILFGASTSCFVTNGKKDIKNGQKFPKNTLKNAVCHFIIWCLLHFDNIPTTSK